MIRSISVDSASLRCDVRLRPNAPALLLLNPLAASLEIWDAQADAFAEQFTLIRCDARGHGGSTLGKASELSMDQLAQDVIAVLDQLEIARAHVCGLSIGGMIGMKLATLWPQRVDKLVLCATTPYMPTPQMWQQRIDTALSQGMSGLIDGVLQRWFTSRFREAQPEAVERVRKLLMKTTPEGYAASAAAIRDMDQRESIRGIKADTLVLAGTHDAGAPPSDAQVWSAAIQKSRLKILDAAHVLNVEQSAAFNAAVLEFLSN
jgi:3-oxoadipate enol-lactonase